MNINFPLSLKATAIAVALTLTLSGCGSESVEDHFANAQIYTEQKDFKSSVISLKKILIEQPDNVVARVKLAKSYISLNRYRDAEKELEAIKPNKTSSEMIGLLAEVKFELKKYAEVYMLAFKKFDKNAEHELKTNFYALLSSIQDGKKDKVQKFIQKIGALDTKSYYTSVGQAWVALSLGEVEESIDLVDVALSKAPEFGQALFLSARLYDISGKVSQAKEAYQKYATLFPYDIDKKVYLYQTLMSLGDIEQAEELIDSVYLLHPKNPLVNLYKAQIYYQKSDYQKSSDFAKNALKDMGQHMPGQLIAGASAYKLGNYKEAYSYLKAYEDKLKDGSVKRMLLLTKLKLGHISEVADDILKSSDSHIELDILMVTSMNLSRTGQQEKAIALLEQTGGEDNAKILAQQGLTLLSMNDSSGIALLEKSIELDGELEGAKLALAMAHLREGNSAAAVEIATQWSENPNTKILGDLLNANIYKQQGKHNKAKQLFKEIIKVNNDNVAAIYGLAKYDEVDGKTKSALKKYIEIVTRYPGHVDALSRITDINKASGQIDETLKFIEPLLVANFDNVKLRLNVAYNQFLKKDTRAAIDTLSVLTPNSQTPDVYWIVLGDSYMQEGLVASGIKAFNSLIKKNPTSLLGQLRYISSLEFAKRYTAALHATKNASVVFKKNKAIDLLLVRYQLLNNSCDEALNTIKAYKSNHDVSAELIAYEAEAKIINKNYADGAALYLKADKLKPQTKYKLGAAKALMNNDERQKSSDLLESIYKKDDVKNKISIALMLGEVNYDHDFEKSKKYFSEVLKTKPNDIVVNNNLAMVSIELGDFEDALKYSERSYRGNSNNTSILNTYGTALVKNNQYDKAKDILEQSLQMGSNNVAAMINLAVAYDKLGKFAAEIRVLDNAIKNTDDPEERKKILSMGARL